MSNLLRALQDEDGAVTIDWVVLTAGVVILAIVVVDGLADAIDALITAIGSEMTFANISGYF